MKTSRDRKPEETEQLKLLSGVELFSTLLDDDLTYVASKTELKQYSEGTVIFRPGEKAGQFFIVLKGSVSVSGKPKAATVELAKYLPGDAFGDFHFVIGAIYDATATALGDTVLYAFPGYNETLETLSSEKPHTASRIMLRSISMIASRLRSTNKLISENSLWIRELRKHMFTDPPTGLWNKSFMDSEISAMLSGTVAILILKPDKFKEIIDSLGHAAGDEIIGRIAALMLKETKMLKRGWAIRLRSNEMAMVLPEYTKQKAQTLADTIQTQISAILPLECLGSGENKLSASICIGFWPTDNNNWNDLTGQIYNGMQRIWRTGGNRSGFLQETDE